MNNSPEHYVREVRQRGGIFMWDWRDTRTSDQKDRDVSDQGD